MPHRPARSSGQRGLIRSAVVLALAALVALVGIAPASAETKGEAGGWVRLAHLSPDTPSVNVALTAVSNSSAMLALSDVHYGDVSAYKKVPAGRYVATMTPAGGNAKSTPSISQAVTVADGRAYTVAAVGKNANLRGQVLNDDLSTPPAGFARVRLLQAAVSAPQATVTAVGGPVLAKDASFGSSTGYATIKAGVWTVRIDHAAGAGTSTTTRITTTPGSVNTIIVLDGPNGSVTAKAIRDAAAAPSMPKRGTAVNTGGGGTATQFVGQPAGSDGSAQVVGANNVAVGGAALLALLLVALGVRQAPAFARARGQRNPSRRR